MIRVAITEQRFSPDAELSSFAADRGGDAGALVNFVGYCRADSDHGAVERLELDHYPGFTEARVRDLSVRTAELYGLSNLLVIHRVGVILPGEAIVLVAALSAHRASAFAAVSELMDYLKTDAPIWKREVGADGARWIEPTETDRARRKAHGD